MAAFCESANAEPSASTDSGSLAAEPEVRRLPGRWRGKEGKKNPSGSSGGVGQSLGPAPSGNGPPALTLCVRLLRSRRRMPAPSPRSIGKVGRFPPARVPAGGRKRKSRGQGSYRRLCCQGSRRFAQAAPALDSGSSAARRGDARQGKKPCRARGGCSQTALQWSF